MNDRNKTAFLTPLKLGKGVERYIRDALLTGRYRAGHRLVIEELAQELGVSTTPVREALIAIAGEGLLTLVPHRGYSVAPVVRQDVEDVLLLHKFIAGEVARRAAKEITDGQLKQLEEIQSELAKVAAAGSNHPNWQEDVERLNDEFHETIEGSVRATRLHWLLQLTIKHMPKRFYASVPGWLDATLAQHPGIIDSLKLRDDALAKRLMDQHETTVGGLILTYLEELGVWQEKA